MVNWLIPGAGFLLVRDYQRGVTLFLAINGCFAIGLLMGGYVLAPASFDPRAEGFNLVGLLTYLAQAFHGGGWLLLQGAQSAAADNPEAFFNLHRLAARTYSDLGAFHLVVAGCLNYFATMRLYDLVAGTPELTEGSPGSADPERLRQRTDGNSAS